MTVIPIILTVFSVFIFYMDLKLVNFSSRGLLRFKPILCAFITAYNIGNTHLD